jgi:hypothetical protein
MEGKCLSERCSPRGYGTFTYVHLIRAQSSAEDTLNEPLDSLLMEKLCLNVAILQIICP